MIDLRKVSKKQFITGMNLALKNARSLLREAQVLAERRASSRSAALAILSLEESGKVVFLTICSHSDRLETNQKTLNRILKRYKDHQMKVDFFESWYKRKWRGALYVRKRKHDDENEENYKRDVVPLLKAIQTAYRYLKSMNLRSLTELKLKCLYVDIDERTHKFLSPCEVPSNVVKGLLLIAKSQIEDAGKLRDTFRRAKTDQISEEIIDLMFEPEMKQKLLRDLS